MKTVALHLLKDVGRQRKKEEQQSFPCLSQEDGVWSRILQIAALVAVFFLLALALPISGAHAESNDLPLLDYEIRDPIVPGSMKISPFVPQAPQWQRYEDMPKSERRAALAQLALTAVGSVYNPIGKAILAVQEPIHGAGGKLNCRTKLYLATYYMRCGLKF